jgi:4-amino-4-deoxy-L-arabinose transferase-like glycosyltransferase
VAWLLPAALVLLVAGLWVTRRAPRTDRTRATLVLWGGWLVVTAATFSFMKGIFHPYYTVALAPAIGALVGIGAVLLWRARSMVADAVLAATVAGTAVWSFALLSRSPDWYPWLRVVILVAGLAAAGLLVFARRLRAPAAAAVAGIAVLTALAGPLGYAVDTATTVHNGAIPSAGPTIPGARFGGPGGGPGGAGPRFRRPGGGAQGGPPAGFAGPPTGGPMAGGGPMGGGLLTTFRPGDALVTLLKTDSSRYRWVAATVGSNNAAGYQLATGEAVMSIGGFNGSDPAPTLAQFQQWVAGHRVHYFIGTGSGGGPGGGQIGGSDVGQQIAEWVAAHYTSTTVDGATVYDLS